MKIDGLPRITRARDFRLYTEAGGRLVDLWQYGGRAVLGHTPPGLLRELKNTASRGLFAPLPSRAEGRLRKALALLFPNRDARFYPDEASLRAALAKAGYPAAGPFPDPACRDFRPGPASLWRPFLADPGETERWPQDVPALIPVLPLPWPGAPWTLLAEPSLAAAFPPSGLLSPVILAVAARCVHDLIAAFPGRGIKAFPRLKKALDQSGWSRRGIYLSPPVHGGAGEDAADYTAVFRRFLDAGFLLPPDSREPVILPASLSPGEEAKLAGLIREV
jgi:hypothetical protein